MGFFNRLFGKAAQPATPHAQSHAAPEQSQTPVSACTTEQQLLERYGAIAFEKQLALGEVIGNNRWAVDLSKSEISFGPQLNFQLQVLGTFSHSSASWLWAWANAQSPLPAHLLQHALQLKNYGEAQRIDLLRNARFDATKSHLHLIGLIASGMLNASGYYIADYGQGAMVVTVSGANPAAGDNQRTILLRFPQFIAQFEMNHHVALSNYLTAKGYVVSESATGLTAMKNGSTITAAFDAQSRLTALNG